jgi:hypothetical protein
MIKELDRSIVLFVIGIILSVCVGIFGVFSIHTNGFYLRNVNVENRTAGDRFVSQKTMGIAQRFVKKYNINPIEASRVYAYTASVCHDILTKTNQNNLCEKGVVRILQELYPKEKEEIGTWSTAEVDTIETDKNLKVILDTYINRMKNDGFTDENIIPNIPQGNGKWIQISKRPILPNASNWQRWIVSNNPSKNVPQPIAPGTELYEKQKDQVKHSVTFKSVEDIANITYWAGGPGTETPSGIWQNKLAEYTSNLDLTEQEYSRIQTLLAQAMADGFMEAWSVKYTYWTERPSMAIPGLKTSMNNPNFPSYVSGHATISSTASTVIGTLLPQFKNRANEDAIMAKNTRLLAGIHFPMDNEEGWKLGERVGLLALDGFD